MADLNNHFPLVARDLTQPVWLLSTTLAIISLSGGSQESTDLPWLPQKTCSHLSRWVKGRGTGAAASSVKRMIWFADTAAAHKLSMQV